MYRDHSLSASSHLRKPSMQSFSCRVVSTWSQRWQSCQIKEPHTETLWLRWELENTALRLSTLQMQSELLTLFP